MKVLSFLGTTDYHEAIYAYGEQECRTRYFPIAVCQFFGPTELLLVMTDAARARHYSSVETELRQRSPDILLRPVPIPEGKSEEELWQLFDALTEPFDAAHDHRLLVDVTHGFRSLPVLAVIAAAYLRVASGVTIERLIYGAWDARDEAGKAPVFDLSPFLTLMDWTAATDQFLATGNGTRLARLLEQAHNLPYLARGPRTYLPRHLKPVAAALRNVSEAMYLARAHEVMSSAAALVDRLDRVRPEVPRWARPFTMLLERTQHAYRPFALPRPDVEVEASLRIQLDLLDWYVSKDQSLEAILLAREWLVSLVTYRQGGRLTHIQDREKVERFLNDQASQRWRAAPPPLSPPARDLTDEERELATVWDYVAKLRNDVAHTGMREKRRLASAIIQDVRTLPQRLRAVSGPIAPGSPPV